MKHLKKYKTFEVKLIDEFLNTIFVGIDKKTIQPIVATVAGQFRFYRRKIFRKVE